MKWRPSRESQRQNIKGELPLKQKLPKSMPLIIGLLLFLTGTGVLLSANAYKLKRIFIPNASQDSSDGIKKIAAEISVKILDEEFLGSGFLVQQKNNEYIVITNQHVLRAGETPYRIQTDDGRIHVAEVVNSPIKSEYQYDLAILKFTAETNYSVAQIGSSLYLEIGEPIFAAGFPYTETEVKTLSKTSDENSYIDETTGFTLKIGRIAMILNQALVEGYQIGYTNDVKKGMSGGPLLISRGEVVGINGKHAYPLWESPELYQDGSQPCPELEKLITRSSLAIPIEKSIELNPELKMLRPLSNVEVTRRSNLLAEDPELVAKMQEEARVTTLSCEQYGEEGNSFDDLSEDELDLDL